MAKRFRVSQTSRRAYRTIGLALQAAHNLRKPVRIEIEPGRYQESLSLGGDVELVAIDGPASVTLASAQGPVIESWGRLRLSDLVLVGSRDEAVRCSAGTLVVERSQIQGLDGVSVWAAAGTSVTLRNVWWAAGGWCSRAPRAWPSAAISPAPAPMPSPRSRVRSCGCRTAGSSIPAFTGCGSPARGRRSSAAG
ncbi:hypothetical protein GCM10018954_088430 [Kutzneria kofuensis]